MKYLLFLLCFKRPSLRWEGSCWESHAPSNVPKALWKVTFGAFTNHLQIAVCVENSVEAFEPVFADETLFRPHTWHIATDMDKVEWSLSISILWEECLSMFSTGILVRLNFNEIAWKIAISVRNVWPC